MSSDDREPGPRPDRLAATLERLLAIDATDLHSALGSAAQLVADALGADKVDTFLYDAKINSLVAAGTSFTPLGQRQIALGLDRLPLVNRGRTVAVFQSGAPFLNGQAESDPDELRGIIDGLGVRSTLAVPLTVGGERRGVLEATSQQPEAFQENDLRFLKAVARWVGLVIHRTELVENLANEAAERARQVVAEELVTILAHDFRNHLVPLKGRLDLMRRRASREDRTRDLQDVEEALQAVDRLSRLIGDLLDVARLEQGAFSLTLQPADVVSLTNDVAEAFRPSGRSIVVRAPVEVVATVDVSRIKQALENLVSNATRYAPEGTPVTLEVGVEAREDGRWAVIGVIDQGAGIAPEVLPRLFERFAVGRDSPGLGIGLHLASKIVQAHGGRLTVESIPGWTRFDLALPIDVHKNEWRAG